jgi:protein-arginine deiminase
VGAGLAAVLVACTSAVTPDGPGGPDASVPEPVRPPDLVVDASRDGRLDLAGTSDEAGEDAFDAAAGAVVVANLDDDNRDGFPDTSTPEIDGSADLLDLAPVVVRGQPDLAEGSTGTLTLDPAVLQFARLHFVEGDPGAPESFDWIEGGVARLGLAQLRAGASFAIEARDLVRSAASGAFDGRITLTLEVLDGSGRPSSSDVVQLRVAPLVFQHNLLRTQKVFHSEGGDYTRLLSAGVDAVRGSADHVAIPQSERDFDPWAQDFFDIASMSRPGPDGRPVAMKVAVRSAQSERIAGEYVRELLGPDVAALELWDERVDVDTHGYSMSSFGNWEVVPPYTKGSESFPLGRNIWGSGPRASERPDPKFAALVQAQAVQPALLVDTTWLWVGHVDEFFSFVPANTPRGWVLLVGSPARARAMLLELSASGHGRERMFVGKQLFDLASEDPWAPPYDAEVSVDAVLADADRLAASQESGLLIDEQLALVQAEIGLAAGEIVPMPFLFESVMGAALAYQPGTVNLLHVDGRLLIPDPFGPLVDGGDPFKTDLSARLGALGLEVHFVDDWDTYHMNAGEVHCGTNVSRDLAVAWWESGR